MGGGGACGWGGGLWVAVLWMVLWLVWRAAVSSMAV